MNQLNTKCDLLMNSSFLFGFPVATIQHTVKMGKGTVSICVASILCASTVVWLMSSQDATITIACGSFFHTSECATIFACCCDTFYYSTSAILCFFAPCWLLVQCAARHLKTMTSTPAQTGAGIAATMGSSRANQVCVCFCWRLEILTIDHVRAQYI